MKLILWAGVGDSSDIYIETWIYINFVSSIFRDEVKGPKSSGLGGYILYEGEGQRKGQRMRETRSVSRICPANCSQLPLKFTPLFFFFCLISFLVLLILQRLF